MAKRKELSKKQLAVIDDLFSAELDEQAILEKHKVNRNVYNRWLADGLFVSDFDRRIMSAHRQSAALIQDTLLWRWRSWCSLLNWTRRRQPARPVWILSHCRHFSIKG